MLPPSTAKLYHTCIDSYKFEFRSKQVQNTIVESIKKAIILFINFIW